MTHSNKLASLLLLGSMLSAAPAFAQDTASSPTGPGLAQTPISDDTPTVREDEVIATGTFIPNEKRITSEITSVLDEEVFAQIGAGDIASALTRVTGLSLAQGKFVIVRGLNERYASATLNGSPLPSPEPLRRVAPLDLFPTSVLSDVVVQKTYSPEFSGEFGGGAINLRTRSVPTETFFEVGISGSANTETSLRQGLTYEGSGTDWLGFDDGLRDLPDLNEAGLPVGNFDTGDTLLVERLSDVPFNGGLRLSGGTVFDMDNGSSVGVLATLGYDNAWETRRGVDNTTRIGGDGVLELRDEAVEIGTENAISLNGLLSVGYEIDENNTLTAVGFGTRQSSSEVRINTGFNADASELQRTDTTEWFEREVYLGQLLGEHFIPSLNDAEVNWRASYAVAGRDAPYERETQYVDDGQGGFQVDFARFGPSNRLRFSELDDNTLDLGLDVAIPVALGDRDVELKFGGAYLDKTRDSQQSTFFYTGLLPSELRDSRIDVVLSDEVVDAGLLRIDRISGASGFPDASDASLETFGAYAALDFQLTEDLQIAGGLRFEDGTQTTAISQVLNPDARFEFDALDESYVLPSITATYTFSDFQLRLAPSKTINRPQFRELTPSIFINTDTNDRFVGNPFLTNSESTNLDARLEYYFASNQFFTIGGFYKDLTNPIEEFIFQGVGESNATSFINAPSAELFGIEAEFERKFDIPSNMGFASDLIGGERFVVRSNYTFVDSSVSADGNVSITPPVVSPDGFEPLVLAAEGLYRDGRKLQGQSDHLANLQLGIEADSGWDAFLLLNYSSERIRAVEQGNPDINPVSALPAINERLPLSLDFVTNIPLEIGGGDYQLGLKVANILGDNYEASQESGGTEILIDSYEIGTTFSASLKRSF